MRHYYNKYIRGLGHKFKINMSNRITVPGISTIMFGIFFLPHIRKFVENFLKVYCVNEIPEQYSDILTFFIFFIAIVTGLVISTLVTTIVTHLYDSYKASIKPVIPLEFDLGANGMPDSLELYKIEQIALDNNLHSKVSDKL